MRTFASARVLSAMIFGLVLISAPACASPRGRVYVRVGPAAPIVEVRRVAPGPGHVWVAGHHRWDGRRYNFVAGSWVAPPRAGAAWVPARWVHDRRGWYFVEGHWRR